MRNDELSVMKSMVRLVSNLEPKAQLRVANWLLDRIEGACFEQNPNQMTLEGVANYVNGNGM